MKLPKKIKISYRKLGKERAMGLAIAPDQIVICPKHRNGKESLDTKIHECLHLLHPEASEMMVRAWAKRLTDLLWRDGYRRVQN